MAVRSLCLVCLFAALALGEDKKPGKHVRLAERLARELSEMGLEIDHTKLTVEVREPGECEDDVDRQQDLFYPASYYEGMWAFFRAFGVDTGDSPQDFRKQTVEGMTGSFVAYYQWDRKALVFVESFLGRLGEISGLEHLVAHELIHAWQDRENGFEKLVAARPRTAEEVNITRTLIEGHAEIAAMALGLRRKGKDVSSIDPKNLDTGIERLLSGEYTSLPYTIGRKLMYERVRGGGPDVLRSCLEPRPASTEQALHPEKRGVDLPVTVTLPAWGGEAAASAAVHEDTLGEMTIFGMLSPSGRDRAWIAATGWDGDRLRVYEMGDENALLWRTVWDRDLDAEQFREAVAGHFEGSVVKRGRVVDLAWSSSSALEAAAAGALEKHPFEGDASKEDAATTAAAEAAWKIEEGRKPRVEAKRWVHEKLGFTLPVPEGFKEQELNGTPVLVGEIAEAFGDNITALELPNSLGKDIQAHITLNRTQLEQLGLNVDSIERAEVGGREVLLIEYHGRMPQHDREMHFLCLVKLEKTRQLVLTGTTLEKRWSSQEERIREAFAGVEFLR